MRSSDNVENMIREANCTAADAMRRRLWQDVAGRLHRAPASGRGTLLRVIAASNLAKFAAAAAIPLVALVLWQTFGAPNKAQALSDAFGIIRQARTIHMRTGLAGRVTWEFWYDIEKGRQRTRHEGVYQKAYNSPETYRESVTTVRDEQYVMTADHKKRTVRFERLLPWDRELFKLRMTDLAINTAFPNVLQHLNQYTIIGQDTIDGQLYDIWRREWRDTRDHDEGRYDIWLSPTTGEIGRTREWVTNSFGTKEEWVIGSETDKIEINREPPPDTFATEPPEGYVLENSKATADILRKDFLLYRSRQGSGSLYALPGFMLEDGSIVAISTVTDEPTQPDPNDAYEGLTLGGPLPETPIQLPGLWFAPAVEIYGSVSFGDEITPMMVIDAVGRHLMSTHKADRTYQWALYVPQEVISSQGPKKMTIGIIKDTKRSPTMLISFLSSLAVTRESFALYLSDAIRELSEDSSVPASMEYDSLLSLAAQIREKRSLYEDFAEQTRELKERTTRSREPVQATPAGGVK